MKRSQIILCALLAIQIALAVWLFWPRPAQTTQGEPLFPGLTAADIVALTITDDTESELALRNVAGQWLLPNADDFPAQAEKIAPLLEQLAALNSRQLVAHTAASHRQLQVADDTFLRRVEFETSDGTSHTLYLGSSPRYDAVHVRVGGQDEVYLASGLSTWDIGPAASLWIDPLYLSVSEDTISRMTLGNANGTFVFEPGEAGEDGRLTWALAGLAEGEAVAEDEVRALATQATYLTMAAPLGKTEQASYGLAAPSASVTIETADGAVTLIVGAQDAQTQDYVAKASSSPYYVQVAATSVSRLVGATREMLVPPQEGEAGGTE